MSDSEHDEPDAEPYPALSTRIWVCAFAWLLPLMLFLFLLVPRFRPIWDKLEARGEREFLTAGWAAQMVRFSEAYLHLPLTAGLLFLFMMAESVFKITQKQRGRVVPWFLFVSGVAIASFILGVVSLRLPVFRNPG